MKIKSSEFVVSNRDYKSCPKKTIPEYAFIGRSNVGKSSLINSLTKRKDLAKTSSKPGKTQLINHFIINKDWFIVDLPGYGYASISKTKREEFKKMTQEYLLKRETLVSLFVLIDIKLTPQVIDLEFMKFLGKEKIPFVIVFTKSDKIPKKNIQENLRIYKEKMLVDWETLPEIFINSIKDNEGRTKILSYIEKYNKEFYSNLN